MLGFDFSAKEEVFEITFLDLTEAFRVTSKVDFAGIGFEGKLPEESLMTSSVGMNFTFGSTGLFPLEACQPGSRFTLHGEVIPLLDSQDSQIHSPGTLVL